MRVIVLLLLLCSMPVVLALDITEDTTLVHGDVTYKILADSGIQEVNLITDGIVVDDDRLITILQGGTLEVTLERWSEGGRVVTLYSSVPQTITFKWVIDGKKQYIKDDIGLHLDTYRIGSELVQISLLDASSATTSVPQAAIERPSWVKRTLFFFILDDKVIKFTNMTLILVLIFISAVIFTYRMVFR